MLHLLKITYKFIFNPKIRFSYLSRLGLFNCWSDEKYIQREYRLNMGKKLNLVNPKTFNEKIQWLKLYDRKPEYTIMVDKLAAKEYVSNLIGQEYIVPLLGVWNSPDEIDFTSLPKQFVLKTTHDSGGIVICRDKSTFDVVEAKKVLAKSLHRDYYLLHREWPYKNVPRRIIAEKYLEDKEGGSLGLRDYKFFNFGGKAKFVYISEGLENHTTAKMSFFDLNGKKLSFKRSDYMPLDDECVISTNFKRIKAVSDKLAEKLGLSFVRTDFFCVNGKIYFSEITFSPCAGMMAFEPKTFDLEIGKLLKLPIPYNS